MNRWVAPLLMTAAHTEAYAFTVGATITNIAYSQQSGGVNAA